MTRTALPMGGRPGAWSGHPQRPVVEGPVLNENATWLSDELTTRGVWPRLVIAVPEVTLVLVSRSVSSLAAATSWLRNELACP